MLRVRMFAGSLFLGLLVSLPAHATYHAAGNFCSTCSDPTPLNQLFDDGLHHDGAAGDGLWGADVVVDRPAGQYYGYVGSTEPFWGEPTSNWPFCWCGQPMAAPTKIWTSGPGDVVHFTFDGRGGPWFPGNSVATNRATPSPTPFTVGIDIFYCDPRWYPPSNTAPMTQSGSIWEATVLIPVARNHCYAFYNSGIHFTLTYNGDCNLGDCNLGEVLMPNFTTIEPNSYVRFQFDEALGRMRHEVLGPTPAGKSSWGAIKSIYR